MKYIPSRNGLTFAHIIDNNGSEVMIRIHPRYCLSCKTDKCDHITFFNGAKT